MRWARQNPGYQTYFQLKTKYGLSVVGYLAMLEHQGHRCAICRQVDSTGKRLAVDHCHNSGKLRGLLCGSCNYAIGTMQDDSFKLRKAADYLDARRSDS